MADAPSTDRETICAKQLDQLRTLLRAVRTANAFYEAKLNAAGIDDSIVSLEDFANRCPFTTKAELVADQETHPPYGSNLTFPIDHYNRIHQTSGTTGNPLRWLDTPESWQSMLDSWQTVYQVAGISSTDRALFAFSFGQSAEASFIAIRWVTFSLVFRCMRLRVTATKLNHSFRIDSIIDIYIAFDLNSALKRDYWRAGT